MTKRVGAAVATATAMLLTSPAHASLITLTGTDFNVVYDTAQLGLFGTPELLGDYLVFTPNQFEAQSLNGAGTVSTSSLASDIQLVAHPGYSFGNLQVEAVGDYLMQGNGTAVGVAGQFTAVDAARPLTQTVVNMDINSPLNVDNGVVQNWSGNAAITNDTSTVTPGYNPWLSAAGTIDVQLANTLTATTTPGSGASQAFIQEKFSSVELIIDPTPVPLPASIWLSLSGLAATGWMLRRHGQQFR